MQIKTTLLPAVLLTLAALAVPTLHAAKPRGDAPAGKTYVYKESAGKPRDMQIYFPPQHDPANARVPGLILFHGGSWLGGNLSQFQYACHYFASRGLVCATANYRMLSREDSGRLPRGETCKRVCITDAKSAIRWFKQHAAELGVDPDRIITGGGSAGGHISVLATTTPGLNDPADPAQIDTTVSAYLLFNPAFSPGDSQDREVDVLRYLQPSLAPAIVFFGDQDSWRVGWEAVSSKLRSLGHRSSQLHIAEGQKHSFFNQDPWRTVTLIAADRFLVQQGFLQGEPTLAAPSSGETLLPAPEPEPAAESAAEAVTAPIPPQAS